MKKMIMAMVLLLSCVLLTIGGSANAESQYETLKPGSKGQAVLDARMRLYELGYFTKVPTQTDYTNSMADYVRKFEKDYGLQQDGILSPEDQEVLFGNTKDKDASSENESKYTTLKPGSKGQAVLDARMRLYELGYFTKVPTQTDYTNNMADYVRKFEKEYGLTQDGILSPEDQEVLFRGEIVTFNPNLSVGDRITLGKWEQDNKTNNGKEPIQWQVLAVQGDRALIITVDGIDTQLYGLSIFDTSLYWETSLLRKWMNETFYSAAFSENEKAVICLTSNDNGSQYSRTDDWVFCLSVAEVGKYFSNASAMACKPTAYAKSKIGKTNALDSSGYGIWWLRDMASTYTNAGPYNFMATTFNEVAYVNMRKGIESKEGMAPVYADGILARPAMWIEFKGTAKSSVPSSQENANETESKYTTLQPGSKGQAVLDARMRLYELGYFSKVPTQTEYTKNMTDYVKEFEKDYGLKQDGILSPEDQVALYGPPKVAVKKVSTITAPSSYVANSSTGNEIDVTYTGDGELKVSSSSTKYFAYKVSNNNEGATITIYPKKAGSATLTLTDSNNKNVKTTIKVTISSEAAYPALKKGMTITLPGRTLKIKSISYQQSYKQTYTKSGRRYVVLNASAGETFLVIKFDLTNTSGESVSSPDLLYINAITRSSTDGRIEKGFCTLFPAVYYSRNLYSYEYGSNDIFWNGETKEMVYTIEIPTSAKKDGVFISLGPNLLLCQTFYFE